MEATNAPSQDRAQPSSIILKGESADDAAIFETSAQPAELTPPQTDDGFATPAYGVTINPGAQEYPPGPYDDGINGLPIQQHGLLLSSVDSAQFQGFQGQQVSQQVIGYGLDTSNVLSHQFVNADPGQIYFNNPVPVFPQSHGATDGLQQVDEAPFGGGQYAFPPYTGLDGTATQPFPAPQPIQGPYQDASASYSMYRDPGGLVDGLEPSLAAAQASHLQSGQHGSGSSLSFTHPIGPDTTGSDTKYYADGGEVTPLAPVPQGPSQMPVLSSYQQGIEGLPDNFPGQTVAAPQTLYPLAPEPGPFNLSAADAGAAGAADASNATNADAANDAYESQPAPEVGSYAAQKLDPMSGGRPYSRNGLDPTSSAIVLLRGAAGEPLVEEHDGSDLDVPDRGHAPATTTPPTTADASSSATPPNGLPENGSSGSESPESDPASEASPANFQAFIPPSPRVVETRGIRTRSTRSPRAPRQARNPRTANGSEQPGRRVRQALNPAQRLGATRTRKEGACIRCRFQKTTCVMDSDDPNKECLTCSAVAKESRKTIHHLPCCRVKLSNAVLFRGGGLELTRRWPNLELKDVPVYDRPNRNRTYFIDIQQGLYSKPLQFEVVQFKPLDGDVTARYWSAYKKKNMVETRSKELGAFCFHSIHATHRATEDYLKKWALNAFMENVQKERKFMERIPGYTHEMNYLDRTYEKAIVHYLHLSGKGRIGEPQQPAKEPERLLFENLFIFWFAVQHTMGSFYIASDEKLGMQCENEDSTYPLFGEVSAPRMICAQFDSIIHKILIKYRKEVMTRLEDFIYKSNGSHWWTIYLVLFILLRQASQITQDRYRHARDNYESRIRYSLPRFVEDLHSGCNNLLLHWHYFNSQHWPEADNPWIRHQSHLSKLGPDIYNLIMETRTSREVTKHLHVWERARRENHQMETPVSLSSSRSPSRDEGSLVEYQGSQVVYDWDDNYYWIAQLFETPWSQHRSYISEEIPPLPGRRR